MSYLFSRQPQKVPVFITANRAIVSGIPCPGTQEILSELERVESRSMQGQLPIVWDKAYDFNVYDRLGNKWIDFTSTIFVTNVGHANKRVVQAMQDVLAKPMVHSYAYVNELRVEYLKELLKFSDGNFEKAFLLSAGTEATEAALKLMRMHGQKKGKRRLGIVCLEGNWHGRTLGAQMMSGNEAQKAWVGYLDPNIFHIPFPYPWVDSARDGAAFFEKTITALEQKGIDPQNDLCGFMLETFQGWGAVFYPNDYVAAVEKYCRDHDILLTFDEMQAGFGRTGKRFGYEHYGVRPDLICCGKGMGNGVPLSGVLGSAAIMDLPSVGNMSSTHSANPLVCAAGLATLKEIEEKGLVGEAERKGKLLHESLGSLKKKYSERISYVMGRGMIAALLFKRPESDECDTLLPSIISEKCMQKGLLVVHTGRESIKIGPPLTITDEALLEGVAVIDEAIDEAIRR